MSQAIIKKSGFAAALIVALFFASSDDARALTCTPGVAFVTTGAASAQGFTLGCATPALWAVLETLTGGAR